MKAVLFPIALLASVAAAQTTTVAAGGSSTGSACAAENIVQTCLDTENTQFNTCGTNDWNCKCAAYNAIVTCYNNCPNDPRQDSARGQQSIFCGYASQFPSSTTKVAGATKSASSGSSDATGATKSGGSSGTGTGTATGAPASKTNAAASDLALNAGGVLAVVAGVVAAVL